MKEIIVSVKRVKRLNSAGQTMAKIAADYGISAGTLYAILKKGEDRVVKKRKRAKTATKTKRRTRQASVESRSKLRKTGRGGRLSVSGHFAKVLELFRSRGLRISLVTVEGTRAKIEYTVTEVIDLGGE